jgi:hypothetical protein
MLLSCIHTNQQTRLYWRTLWVEMLYGRTNLLGGLSYSRNDGVYLDFYMQFSLYKFCTSFGSVGAWAMVLPVDRRGTMAMPTNCKSTDMGSRVVLSGSQIQTCSYFHEAESVQTFHCNDEVVEVVHTTYAGLGNNLALHRLRLWNDSWENPENDYFMTKRTLWTTGP